MFLYRDLIFAVFLSIYMNKNICLPLKLMKYSSLTPGKVTKPAADLLETLQVKSEEDCLLHCHDSESCTSYEVSDINGQYTCTLRELFSEDPVNQVDSPGVTSYFLGECAISHQLGL